MQVSGVWDWWGRPSGIDRGGLHAEDDNSAVLIWPICLDVRDESLTDRIDEQAEDV